ncbi:MAG TPA: hypothetical protein VM934_01305 [Pyrinomonadaceae bacterium]|jgi:hypothetical protein|nr:hypothetical protein [Pyrinomonadaceae bacterium]
MTPQDHNKTLGIMHMVYGGFHALMLLVAVFFIFIGGGMAASGGGGGDPEAAAVMGTVFLLLGGLMVILFLMFGLMPLIAGYGMLQRKPWARTLGIVAAILAALNFPFGTALAVYSLWFLFGEGKQFYAGAAELGAPQQQWQGALNEQRPDYGWEAQRAPQGWEAQPAPQSREQKDYVPPQQPPDWRS